MKNPNISEMGRIADRAQFLVEREFERYQFTGPAPDVSSGVVEQVLQAYREVMEGEDDDFDADDPPASDEPPPPNATKVA